MSSRRRVKVKRVERGRSRGESGLNFLVVRYQCTHFVWDKIWWRGGGNCAVVVTWWLYSGAVAVVVMYW